MGLGAVTYVFKTTPYLVAGDFVCVYWPIGGASHNWNPLYNGTPLQDHIEVALIQRTA